MVFWLRNPPSGGGIVGSDDDVMGDEVTEAVVMIE